ncbi:cationic peroxidase SPC4 [Triticum aestivum]|uniref:cationic peroxidase SPC4 n=1 Tax=Triticum aestivum TaxID=4565 RepID=UPI001D01383C|nr:cationic peroxidase SPC4-like [Triticum aestivum]
MATSSSVVVLAVLATVAALVSPAMSLPVFTGDVGVSPGFHAASCPQLDGVVRSSVVAALRQEVALAAGLLRLYFHDCFPQGCDASILLNTTSARETDLFLNIIRAIRARQLIQTRPRRAPDHSFVPGPQNLRTGPAASVAALVESFGTRGLGDVADLVALSGAHTIGRSHCGSFADRYRRADDTFSRKLAANCSKHPDRLQNLDVVTPDLFDNGYYKALRFNQGVLTSDMALVKNKTTAAIVKRFAQSKDAFFRQFARSMEKLARAPKPAGNVGEIRRFSCFRTNAQRADAAVDAAGEEEEGFAASA